MDRDTRDMFGWNGKTLPFSGSTIPAVIAAPDADHRWVVDSQVVASSGTGTWRLTSATLSGPLIRHTAGATESPDATMKFGKGEAVNLENTGAGEGWIEYHKEQ